MRKAVLSARDHIVLILIGLCSLSTPLQTQASKDLAPTDNWADDFTEKSITSDNQDAEAVHADDPIGHRVQLLRELLAWDPARRNVSAAVAGYNQLAATLGALMEEDWESNKPQYPALSEATFDLAVLTLTGLAGETQPQNTSHGIGLLQLAAKAGSVEAQLALAHRYELGLGLDHNCSEAFMRALHVARSFKAEVEELGVVDAPLRPFFMRQRWEQADYSFQPGTQHQMGPVAEAYGSSEAIEDMGLLELLQWPVGDGGLVELLTGFSGQQEDTPQAIRRLADEGHGSAMLQLGHMLWRGREAEQNVTAAMELFNKARMRGTVGAANALGVMAYHGIGTPANESLARQYFEEGAREGDPKAQLSLGSLYMKSANTSDWTRGYHLFKHAYDAGNWEAPLQLAWAHYYGKGTKADCKPAMWHLNEFLMEQAFWHHDILEAVKSFDASGDEWKALIEFAFTAEQGSTAAQDNLAFTLQRLESIDLPIRHELAYEMFRRAGSQIPSATTQAAHLVWRGLVHRLPEGFSDSARAIGIYSEAAEHYEPEALFSLGRAYQQGRVVSQNLSRAEAYYKFAAEIAQQRRHALPSILMLWIVRVQQWNLQLPVQHLYKKVKAITKEDAILCNLIVLLLSVLWLKLHRRQQHRHN